MHSNISNGSRAAWARGFVAFFAIMLAIELRAMALSAEAAPFAYVANSSFNSNTVSVIDTATTPRRWWPRSRWEMGPMGSPSHRMANTPM